MEMQFLQIGGITIDLFFNHYNCVLIMLFSIDFH